MKSSSITTGFTLLLLLCESSLCAQTIQRALTVAPPLRTCTSIASTDLGDWDDVAINDLEETVIVRRDSELFELLLSTTPTEIRRLAAISVLINSKIIAVAGSSNRLWLLMQSSQRHPFTIDANSGAISEFVVPGLTIPGSQAPQIQSHIIVRHSNAVLLMISGGDRQTWPRDGNRPVYFWMSLVSGKVIQFPVGWDLDYLSSDQHVAVFAQQAEKQFDPPTLHAVELSTGDFVAETSNGKTAGGIPFNWTDKSTTKAFYRWQDSRPSGTRFSGLSIDGIAVPIDVGVYRARDGGSLRCNAKVHDHHATFTLWRTGDSLGTPSPFWLVNLQQPNKPLSIANNVTDFALLGGGNCIFVGDELTGNRPIGGPDRKNFQAFVHQPGKHSTWNVLDGVERLPDLSKELAEKHYVSDKLTVRLVECLGRAKSQALCLFWHSRLDLRSFPFGAEPDRDDPPIERLSWRRAILVSDTGERQMTDVFRDDRWPDYVWLHDASKKVVFGNYERRQIHLWETTLQRKEDNK